MRGSTGVLFIPSVHEYGEMILTGETELLGEKPVPLSLCPPQFHMTDPGANPGLRGEMSAANSLSHEVINYYSFIFTLCIATNLTSTNNATMILGVGGGGAGVKLLHFSGVFCVHE
jgi:hypothetical protein